MRAGMLVFLPVKEIKKETVLQIYSPIWAYLHTAETPNAIPFSYFKAVFMRDYTVDGTGLEAVTTLKAGVFVYKRTCGEGTFQNAHECFLQGAGWLNQGREAEIGYCRFRN